MHNAKTVVIENANYKATLTIFNYATISRRWNTLNAYVTIKQLITKIAVNVCFWLKNIFGLKKSTEQTAL